jgi:hypothetical protein
VITDIPISSDFQNAGINLLNLAWDSTVSLLMERIVDVAEVKANSPVSDLYWKSAQPILASSLSLVQQSVEFFLKGKIAEVSPYLLISGTPSNFPKNSHKQDTSFSDFRTIDSQDLIRVLDTVSTNRLPDEFCQWYDELRRLRNKLMHTVDRTIAITDKDVLIKVMEGCEYCIRPRSWVEIRSQYLMNSPGKHLLQDVPLEHIDDNEETAYHLRQLQSEIMTVIEYLEPQYSKRFFGFQKKQRRYICLNCLSTREHDTFFEYKNIEEIWLNSAQFDKSHPDIVHCIFCDGDYRIKREKCKNCGNDVLDAHNGLCLSCTGFIPKNIKLQPSIKVVL